MSKEPMQTGNRLRDYLDKTCEKIIEMMMMNNQYENDKIRYNALYKQVKPFLNNLSKPTFNSHIQHLVKKRLLKREKQGKQQVYFYLNDENLIVENGKEMKATMDQETKQLLQIMAKPEFWVRLPSMLAYYFTLCELRRTQIIVKYMLAPHKARENLLAVAFQAKMQDMLEEHMLNKLTYLVPDSGPEDEKKNRVQLLVKALDDAIKEVKNDFKQFVDRHPEL